MLKPAPYQVPDCKKIRVIADTDAACEADDQYAICHLLMSPKMEVVAITAEHFGCSIDPQSAESSYCEICHVVDLMGLTGEVPVKRGCMPMTEASHFKTSEASEFIVAEALRDDPRPLFFVCQGAITNLAVALKTNPAIASRLTCIWIGGGAYPRGGWEFNTCNDLTAINIVMDSDIDFWQVPSTVYSLMKVSFSTLYDRVRPCGEIGRYLFDKTNTVSQYLATMIMKDITSDPEKAKTFFPEGSPSLAALAAVYPGGENWQLCDSAAVGLLLVDHAGHYTLEGAPLFAPDGQYILRPQNSRKIRVYNYIDSQFILEDFYAKLKYHFGG